MSDGLENFLAHHGVKGMKWGVRKKKDLDGNQNGSKKKSQPPTSSSSKTENAKVGSTDKSNSDNDSMKKAITELLKNESIDDLNAEGRRKLKAQADMVHSHKPLKKVGDLPDDSDITASDIKEGRLSKKQKIALGVGAAIVVSGLAVYGSQKIKAHQTIDLEDLFSSDLLKNKTNESYPDMFYAGLKTGKALDRPGFTLPASTTLQRLSNHREDGSDYGKGTYVTFLYNDSARYGASHEFGTKKYTLKFKPRGEVKVPSTRTVMDVIKHLDADKGIVYSDAEAADRYKTMCGGNWATYKGASVVKALKKQGYSALVDDMDAGYLGDLPIVFFGETSNIKTSKRSVLSRPMDIVRSAELRKPFI